MNSRSVSLKTGFKEKPSPLILPAVFLAIATVLLTLAHSQTRSKAKFHPTPSASTATPASVDSGAPWTITDLSLELLPVAEGTYKIGADSAMGWWEKNPSHRVFLSAFWLGKYEVTQGTYRKIMDENPSRFQGDSLPVEQVRWYEAMEFCRRLTERERRTGALPEGYVFRLPTEAEWEAAFNAQPRSLVGEAAAVAVLEKTAWYRENSGAHTHLPGSMLPSPLGFHDMLGNVQEWCWDRIFSPLFDNGTYIDGISNPVGKVGELRVRRGGSWDSRKLFCRASFRNYDTPGSQSYDNGFRVALAPELEAPSLPSFPKAGLTDFTGKDVGRGSPPEPGKAWTVPGLEMKFKPIKAGSFKMGAADKRFSKTLPVHEVRLTSGFWIGAWEVGWKDFNAFTSSTGYESFAELRGFSGAEPGEWRSFRRGVSWKDFREHGNLPVTHMTWYDAVAFGRWLTDREKAAGRLPKGMAYRLPTDAEWEYACRAGSTGDFPGDLDKLGWHKENAIMKNHDKGLKSRGLKSPNAWGLQDMTGNVMEWALDASDGFKEHPSDAYISGSKASSVENPLCRVGPNRSLRNGGYSSPPLRLASWYRWNGSCISASAPDYGFRLVLGGDIDFPTTGDSLPGPDAWHSVIRSGDSTGLSALIAADSAGLNRPGLYGLYPLHQAARYRQPALLRFLLQKGADVNSLDGLGGTALHWAAGRGVEREIAASLIAGGAKVEAFDDDGRSPLHEAAFAGNTEIMKSLLDEGARADVPAVSRQPKDVHSSGVTPLMEAVNQGHGEAAALLLRHRANPLQSVGAGETLLHHAPSAGIAKMLIEAGCVVNARIRGQEQQGLTPLHAAVDHGRVDVVGILLAAGAKANFQTATGETPLHFAARTGHIDMLLSLLDSGADPNLVDRHGKTALDLLRAMHSGAFPVFQKTALEKARFRTLLLQDKMRFQEVERDDSLSWSFALELENPFGVDLGNSLHWRLAPESGWKIKPQDVNLTLKPGQSKIIGFEALYSPKHGRFFPIPSLEVAQGGQGMREYRKKLSLPLEPKLFQDRHRPTLICPRITESPVVDGKLGDACWKGAVLVKYLLPSTLTSLPSVDTHIWLAYDERHLYVAVHCQEPDLSAVASSETARDGDIFLDDSFGLFLDTEGDRENHFRLGANAAGVAYDAYNGDKAWNGKWHSAAGREGAAWTLEMKIPWIELECDAPRPGTSMGLQFLRTRVQSGERLQWSPAGGKEYTPSRFGTLEFSR